MDSNTILLWMAGLSTGLLSLRLVRTAAGRRTGWMLTCVLVIAGTGAAWWLVPEHAGHIGGALWGLTIMTPLLASRAVTQAVLERRWAAAKRAARVASWTHPGDGLREHPQLVHLLQALDEGRPDDVADELDALAGVHSPLAWTAMVLRFRGELDWPALVAWIESQPYPDALLVHPPVLAGMVRGLGELGRVDEMLELVERLGEHTLIRRDALTHALIRAQAAAFVGRADIVGELFDGAAGAVPQNAASFWVATAEQVAGDVEGARRRLEPLLDKASVSLDKAVRDRLERPLPPLPADALSDAQRRNLDAMAADSAHERRFASLTTGARRRTPATYGLVALLAAVFALELPGGATDLENLVELGALVVPVTAEHGEWWRRVTAGFLHFGAIHLVMNMAGLVLLGRWLERTLGSAALLACHLLCTLASIGLFPVFADPDEVSVLVGASGGVMGLLGALLGVALVGRTQGSSELVSKQLQVLLLLVAIQLVFDTFTPQVSSLAHMLGLASGLAFGLLAGWKVARGAGGGRG